MTNSPGPLGQRIAAELRAELGRQNHSRRWLADQVQAPHNTVSRWLNGETPPPLDSLDAICRALGLSIADLLQVVEQNGGYEPTGFVTRRRLDPSTRQVSSESNGQLMSSTRVLDAEYLLCDNYAAA